MAPSRKLPPSAPADKTPVPAPAPALHVLALDFENYRKLKALHLGLSYGQPLQVVGPTGQGKTTAVSALWEVLEVVGDPINHGAKKGSLRIKLGTPDGPLVTVERKYTASGAELSIKDENGDKVNARDFASWFCSLAVNPHKIMEMKPAERLATLLGAVQLPAGVSLEHLDQQRAAAAEARLMYGRDLDRAKAVLPLEPPKREAVDIVALSGQVRTMQEHNSSVEEGGRRLNDTKTQISTLEAELAELRKTETALQLWLAANPPKDMDALDTQLQHAQQLNQEAAAWQNWNEKAQAVDGLNKNWDAADAAVKYWDEQRRLTLEAAAWPLPGLTIEDGTIHYRGTPLEGLGTSEQMLICGAISAAAICQKPLRVVRLDGVESMSAADFAALAEIYQRHGIQVFASRVSRGDVEPGEIIIVDGSVQESAAV